MTIEMIVPTGDAEQTDTREHELHPSPVGLEFPQPDPAHDLHQAATSSSRPGR